MINWYQDKKMTIKFSAVPNVQMRLILPSMTETEKKEIAKCPFINKTDLKVELLDNKKRAKYIFDIQKGYTWDGATIPRPFWRLIGAKTDPKFLIPSLIHDVLCENHGYVDNDRYFSTRVFERLLFVSGVNPISRHLMFHSVDNFQKFCNWRTQDKGAAK